MNPVFLLIKSVWDGTNACGHSGRRILQDTTSTQSIGLVVCDRTVSMGALQCLLSQRVIGEMIIWPVEIQAGNKHWRHGIAFRLHVFSGLISYRSDYCAMFEFLASRLHSWVSKFLCQYAKRIHNEGSCQSIGSVIRRDFESSRHVTHDTATHNIQV